MSPVPSPRARRSAERNVVNGRLRALDSAMPWRMTMRRVVIVYTVLRAASAAMPVSIARQASENASGPMQPARASPGVAPPA